MRNAASSGERRGPYDPSGTFLVHGTPVPAPPLEPGLYVVATPIGNLADVTLRALSVLAAADGILAEDTRAFAGPCFPITGSRRRSAPYHEHNAAEVRPRALRRIAEGQALALISDAGTPLISDPGFKLVAESIAAGLAVTAAPGASAALAALCVAGLPTDRFFFEGFLPPKSAARRERINALASVPATLVFYEAPTRLAECLADLALELGPRPAAIARELTKLHEEVRRGALDASPRMPPPPARRRGEIVVVVGAAGAAHGRLRRGPRRRTPRGPAQPFGQGRRFGRGRAARAATPRRSMRARSRSPALAVSARSPLDRTARRREAHGFGLNAEWIAAALVEAERLFHPRPALRGLGRRNRSHRPAGRRRSPSSR